MPHTVILGAGLAGLSCAYALKHPYFIIERDSEVGGVAKTFKRGDFFFDCTGHWLHLRDAKVQQLVQQLLGDQLQTIERRAAIYSHGIFTPYPFQAHTYGLPTEIIADCLLGFFKAQKQTHAEPPHSFAEFILRTMGEGIAKHFMLPYNQKIWTIPPSEMAYDWCARFVPVPTAEEVVYGALQPRGTGKALGYNTKFYYPKKGGMGILAKALAEHLPVRLKTEVKHIDWRNKKVTLNNDETFAYDHLISTIPLTQCIEKLVHAPETILDAAKQLRSANVTYWDLGFAGPNKADEAHWVYCPEPHIPFYRFGSPSAASKGVAPKNCRSYSVEVSHRTGTSCSVTDQQIIDNLRAMQLVGANEEPIVCEKNTLPSAYVIMDQAYGAARKIILDWLALQNIQAIGRYGAWTYDSMEGAMLQGFKAADLLNT